MRFLLLIFHDRGNKSTAISTTTNKPHVLHANKFAGSKHCAKRQAKAVGGHSLQPCGGNVQEIPSVVT
jgi:hypothetical protein